MRLSFRVSISHTSSLFCGLPFLMATGIMRNAASLPLGSQRALTKEQPVVPIAKVGLVESNLTPPRSLVVGVPHIFGVAKRLACRLSTVNRLDNRAQVGTSEGLPRAFIRRARWFAVDSRGEKDGKANGHRTTQRCKAQRGRAAGMAARAQQKRAGVFLPVESQRDCPSFSAIGNYTGMG